VPAQQELFLSKGRKVIMVTRAKHLVHGVMTVLTAVVLGSVGCATAPDDPADQAELDSTNFELATQAQIDALGPDLLSLEAQPRFGCSNRQIRSAQDACRNTFCGTRGSNGIHFCDQRPPNVVAQCDCKTGADPTITCSLTDCPQ
jgi:hypothetical protein